MATGRRGCDFGALRGSEDGVLSAGLGDGAAVREHDHSGTWNALAGPKVAEACQTEADGGDSARA